MFSIVKRLFGKKEEKKVPDTGLEDAAEKDGALLYTKDFEGADEIRITAEDCARENVTAVARHIVRLGEVKKVADLLYSLPAEGTEKIEMTPCTEHTLTAYKFGVPFAQVMFYKRKLKCENNLFIVNDKNAELKEEALFKLIEIRPAK